MQDFTLNKGKLAIIVAGLFCLYAVYGAVSDFKLPGEAEALEPADPIVELDPVNIQLLTKTHLFGQPPQIKVAKTRKVTNNNRKVVNKATRKNQKTKVKQEQKKQQLNTKPIKINVTVTGLLASADENFAAAILRVDNKPEKLYKVGEDLGKPEVKLQSVELESVIIDNNGNEQTIAMKRPGLESSKKAGNNRTTNRSNNSTNSNRIPELPPELELPEELQLLDDNQQQGAYTPSVEEFDFEEPPLPEELEEELLLEQLHDELDEDIQAELEAEISSEPNFQMPVF